MNLFTVGPVNMSDEIRKLGSEPTPYFRTEEFSAIMLEIQELLRKLLDCSENAKAVMLTASGTGAMEAAIANVFTKEDKVLVIDGGSFGHRFAELCQCFQIPHDILKLDFEEDLTERTLEPYHRKGYTALLVNLHETSIGKLYDYQLLGKFCKENHMYYIVDAISTFLADELSMNTGMIDMILLSSQKGLALPPGLSFVVMSQRIIEERIQRKEKQTLYFDLSVYLKNMERGQTPFTPAVGIIYQLYAQLKRINEAGIKTVLEYHKELAVHFRSLCTDLEIQIPAFSMSNALTTVLIPNGRAMEVFEEIKDRYQMTVTPNGGIYQNTLIRIGHLGEHTKEEYTILAGYLKSCMMSEIK